MKDVQLTHMSGGKMMTGAKHTASSKTIMSPDESKLKMDKTKIENKMKMEKVRQMKKMNVNEGKR